MLPAFGRSWWAELCGAGLCEVQLRGHVRSQVELGNEKFRSRSGESGDSRSEGWGVANREIRVPAFVLA